MNFDRISGAGGRPPVGGAGEVGGAAAAQSKKVKGGAETPPEITTLDKKGGTGEVKPDAGKPVLDKPDLSPDMTTEELDALIQSAYGKFMEGDTEALSNIIAQAGGQTIQEQTNAINDRLNKNPMLQQLGVKVGSDGRLSIKDSTGQQVPINQTRQDFRMIQQMLLAILLQQVKEDRAEAAGDRQKYLQSQSANQIIQAINKQIESDKAKESGGEAGKAGTIIGWVAAALSIIVGVLTANPALIVGGLIAVTMMTLQQTGAMEKMTTAFAKSLEQSGMSPAAAQIFASVFITVVVTAVTIAATFGAGSSTALANVAKNVAQTVAKELPQLAGMAATVGTNVATKVGQVGTIVVTLGQGATSATASGFQYEAGKKQAEATGFEGNAQELDFNIQQMIDAMKQIASGANVLTSFSKQMQSQYTTLGGIYGNII